MFIATTLGGEILTSTNGLAWTLQYSSEGGLVLAQVAYNGGSYVGVGIGGLILQSGVFTPHPAPGNLQSTPPPDTWSVSSTVSVSWDAASDTGNGVAGYSYVWDTSPATEPDNTVETTLTSATSPALADGIYYFHICTVDKSGNKSSTMHWGPFLIDTSPPSAGSMSINSGAAYTTSQNVTLNLNATDSVGVTAYYSSDSRLGFRNPRQELRSQCSFCPERR